MNTGSENTRSENTQAKATANAGDATNATSTSAHVPSSTNLTREELMHMHAKDLLQMLDERHINHLAVVEKPELVDLILEQRSH
ncbi:hypothetical protein EC957_000285 [Mortierella hygrophila]|uniref:RNF34/RFFL SAP domain-containing protein n=1 Tax=Mortierella hygrophila TaxID=979708 RepID=A0A9P6F6D4_9FUNG|nr:hypothetical protein EC957_000285 [Mortierella hygrophila]